MTTLSPDTHPSAEQLQIDLLQSMPTWRKVELMAKMSQALRVLALAGLRQRHPGNNPAQRKRRLADLMLGPELAAQVYGPLPEEASADVLLAKLKWYRAGRELSDLQWRDVLGELRMQWDRLDREYMLRMATELGVSDLLDRAFEET